MNYLNYEFFEEFKSLDNICKDIYGESPDKKLGVTLYLEDMDKKSHQGLLKVPQWASDYNKLKTVRNIRNELAHSRNSFSVDICSQENIDFICSFKARLLNQTDPIALLRKQASQSPSPSNPQPKQTNYTYNTPSQKPAGCLGIIASFLVVIACIIAFLL